MSRAEWKLQTGKPAEALSAHYRLDCDYGTAVITCWEKGGIEPIYVCEAHAKELGPSRGHGPEARILSGESEPKDSPIKRENRSQTEEISGTKQNGVGAREAAQSAAEPKAGRAATDAPGKNQIGRAHV